MRAVEPYSILSAPDEAAVAVLAAAADVAVVVSTPFGPENVGNLRVVADSGVPAVLVGELGPDMDFSRGEASRLWSRLREAGAVGCTDSREVVRCIEEVRR